MKRFLKIILAVFILTASLAGCETKKATITTTVYPVRYIVQRLAEGKVDIEYVSSDDFIQRATLVRGSNSILERTSLFIYIGELEPYMDIYQNDIYGYDFSIINLASLSAIDKFKRYTTTTTPSGVSVVTESEYYDSPLFANVDTYNKDPFIWLDPIAASSIASTIKDWLVQRYPEDSLLYENNFKNLQAELVRMDAEYQSLKSLTDIKIVTVGATFGNWQKTYGINVYPLVLSKYGALPTEAQLKFIEAQIKEQKIKYIAFDETLPEDMKELYAKVKEDLKLEEIKLSSLSKLSESDMEKNKDYMTIMYENLKALEDAFKPKDKKE